MVVVGAAGPDDDFPAVLCENQCRKTKYARQAAIADMVPIVLAPITDVSCST